MLDRRIIAACAAANGAGGNPYVDGNTLFASKSTAWDDFAQLAIDLSNHRASLTNATTYATIADHPSTDQGNPRCMELMFRWSTGTGATSALHKWSSGGSQAWGIRFDRAAQQIQSQRGPDWVSMVVPSLAASARRFYAAISVENTPSGSGSTAWRSIIQCWNLDTEEYATATLTHGATAVVPDGGFVIGAATLAGGFPFDGDIAACRISDRVRTRAQIEANTLPHIIAGMPA